MNQKTILGIVAAVIIGGVSFQYFSYRTAANFENTGFVEGAINVTLLNNAGIMIEVNDMRIYIDPYDIPQTYSDYPADAILITHSHGDHYQASTINMLQKEDTLNVFPRIMNTEITRHDGVGVVPEEEFMIGEIKVTPYYMYTFSPVPGGTATHPASANFTSYIVDIDGFTIFHGGDTKNLPEYEALTGTINVAMLPLGPGCQTMYEDEVVDALDVIDPEYFIPIHFQTGQNDQFCSRYRGSIEAVTDCTICNLDHYTTHAFYTD